MKNLRNLFICLLLVIANSAFAADSKFVLAIEKGLQLLQSSKSSDQFLLAANHFERIAGAEPKEWLPLYYAAYSNVYAGMSASGNSTKDELFDKALSQLKTAEKISQLNSEIVALEGYAVLMKLAVDPMVRGMQMMPEGMSLLEKAKGLNPDNPRSYLIQGQFVFFMPEAFGGGKAKARPILQTGKEKYDLQDAAASIEPRWGKNRLEDLLKQANE